MTDKKNLLISFLRNNGFNFSWKKKWTKSTISVQIIIDKVIIEMIGPAKFYDIFDFNINSKKFDKNFKNFKKRLKILENILERYEKFNKKITFLKENFEILSKSQNLQLESKSFIEWNNKNRFETILIIPKRKKNDIIFNEIEILITEFGKVIPIKDFSFTTKIINNEKIEIINKEFEKRKNLFHELKISLKNNKRN